MLSSPFDNSLNDGGSFEIKPAVQVTNSATVCLLSSTAARVLSLIQNPSQPFATNSSTIVVLTPPTSPTR
jgi:hypothetical protein